jgi:hypothetical protein
VQKSGLSDPVIPNTSESFPFLHVSRTEWRIKKCNQEINFTTGRLFFSVAAWRFMFKKTKNTLLTTKTGIVDTGSILHFLLNLALYTSQILTPKTFPYGCFHMQ